MTIMNLKATLNISVCVALYFSLFGCTSEKRNESSLLYIDVSASYPEKEIQLEDIADIEYLQLAVNEEFLFSASPLIITTEKMIIQESNGEILTFTRDGKPLYKFNHRGNGPGEYPEITGAGTIRYEEALDEILVPTPNKIMVYASSGEFRREIPMPKRFTFFSRIENFDTETLLLYDSQGSYPASFLLISKEDGSVVDTVYMPNSKEQDFTIRTEKVSIWPGIDHIVRHKDGYLLNDGSHDTLYYFSSKKELLSTLVRTPKIHSMNPKVILFTFVEVGNYEFIGITKRLENSGSFSRKYLMRDKKTGFLCSQRFIFRDYKGKVINDLFLWRKIQDSRLLMIDLSLVELQDANRENKLSGKLKELVDNSDEDGNDIYMLLHFK